MHVSCKYEIPPMIICWSFESGRHERSRKKRDTVYDKAGSADARGAFADIRNNRAANSYQANRDQAAKRGRIRSQPLLIGLVYSWVIAGDAG